MPVDPPDDATLRSIAQRYGLGLTDADLTSFRPFVEGLLASWGAVEELYTASRPAMPERAWSRPEAADNPFNAWYVTTSITGSGEGPLTGKTVAVKDNTAVAGVPMMNGAGTMEGYTPLRDATVVTRVLAAGATITGKAVCEDLCFSGGSHTSQTGPVRNPWDETRSAGGSSSGSAALVMSGIVDVATGGDQGGSVRIPSAYSGTVGHKPTWGLVPYTGAFPIEATIDHVGPITRTVADAALVLNVIAGPDGFDPRQPRDLVPGDYVAALARDASGLRVGVVTEGFGHPNSEAAVDDAVRAATETLRGAGLVVEDVSIPWHLHGARIWDVIATEGAAAQMVDANGYGMNWKGLYDPEVIEHYGGQWRSDGTKFSETVKFVLLTAGAAMERHHGKHYAMAQNLAYELRRAYDEALSRYDVLVMPTLPMQATVIPGPDAPRDEILMRGLEMIANTCVTDVTGHPACSVPAGQANGLPTGMMIIGNQWDDATVLRVAHTFEQAVGGFPAADVRDGRKPVVNGVHDLGGTDGLGPVPVPKDEPLFRAEWEKAAFAMFSMPFRAGFFGVDAFRYGIEQMHPAAYLLSPYYEHWMHTVEHYGVAKGVLDEAEIDKRMQYFLENPDAPMPQREDPDLMAFVDWAVHNGVSAARPSDTPARFAVGDRVTVIDDAPYGHTRKARYVRGKTGIIEMAHGTMIYPDSAGNGGPEAPEHVYTIKFTNEELWGAEAAEPNGVVYFDVWEPYIEAAS